MQVELFESEKITLPAPGAPHDHLWYNRPYLGTSHIWACPITAVTLAKTFLPAIGQHAIYIESRSPDPLNKSHSGISHIWACLITAVTPAKPFERLWLVFFKNSQSRCFLPAIVQHAIYIESRSPYPL